MNIDVENGKSIRKLVSLGTEYGDATVIRVRAKEFTMDDSEIIMLEMYYQLIVQSTYLRDEVYDFLVRGNTYKQIIKKYRVKSGNLRNLIYRQTKELFDEIGNDPLAKVILKECNRNLVEANISRITEMLDRESIRVVHKIQDIFTFDIESKSEIDRTFNKKIEEDEFQELANVMKYYVKPYRDLILNSIDERLIGYIYYLLRTDDDSLLEEDLARKNYLRMGWMLK